MTKVKPPRPDRNAREGDQRGARGSGAATGARRRKLIAYGVPAAILAAIAVVAIVRTVARSGEGTPSAPDQVQVSGPARTEPLAVGQAVPGFSAPGLDRRRVGWADVHGAPTVLIIWASWCPHCQRELPLFRRLAPEFPAVRVLTVTTAIGLHPGPTPEEYVREQRLTFPVAIDDARGTVGSALGVQAFPTVYWVGADGRVKQVTQGEVGEAALRASFQALAAG